MDAIILYVFMTVITDGVINDATTVYPRMFATIDECHEMTVDENRTNMYRYLSEKTEGEIYDMRMLCLEDLSTTAENYR